MKLLPKNISILKYFFITILLLLIPLGYYFFYYIPSQKAFFTNQNLRVLGNMSQHISTKITHYKSTLEKVFIKNDFIKTSITEKMQNETSIDPAVVNAHLKSERIEDFITTKIEKMEDLKLKASKIQYGSGLFDSLIQQSIKQNGNKQGQELIDNSEYSFIDFDLAGEGDNFNLQISYLGRNEDKQEELGNYSIYLRLQAQINRILQPLLQPDIFDNILLLEYPNENVPGMRVIYQTVQKEFIASQIDSIANGLKATWSSFHQEIVFANTRYQLYLQPVRISILNEQNEKSQPKALEWMLVGLVESKRFNAQCRAISHFKAAFFVFLVALVLISIPLLKLNFIGTQEELKRIDIILATIAIYLGSGILIFLILSIYSTKKNREHLDFCLERFSQEIEQNFIAEIDECISQINHFDSLTKNQSGLIELQMTEANLKSPLKDSPIIQVNIDSLKYPWFSLVYWFDKDGKQTRKIGTKQQLTPLVSLPERQYFQKIIKKQSWLRKEQQFFIEPIYSTTTGENMAVVSTPSSDSTVGAISVHFISLQNTVVPEGFGFCIIDQTGDVLFHQKQNKNLQENFFQESNHNAQLQATVFSRTAHNLYVNYLGRSHRIFVRPLTDLPWTLITFSDQRPVRSSELSALMTATILFALYLVFHFIIIILLRVFNIIHDFDWLWPNHKFEQFYRILIILSFASAGFIYSLIFKSRVDTNILIVFILPFFLFCLTLIFFQSKLIVWLEKKILKFRIQFQSVITLFFIISILALILFPGLVNHQAWFYGVIGLSIGFLLSTEWIAKLSHQGKFPAYYIRYAMCCVAFLLLISFLPAIIFFKISYNFEFESYVKQGQLSLMHGLESRKVRIYEELGRVPIENNMRGNADTLISRRLKLDQAKDIYASFFHYTSIGNPFTVNQILEHKTKPDFVNMSPGKIELFGTAALSSFDEKTPSPLESLLAVIRSKIKIVNYRCWEMHHESTADSSWKWKRLGDDVVLLEKKTLDRCKQHYIISIFRHFNAPDTYYWFWGLPAVFLVLFWILIYFVRKVFTLETILPSRVNVCALKPESIFQNTLYIGPPNSGKSDFMSKILKTFPIDFRKFTNPKHLMQDFKNHENYKKSEKIIVLDHFDRYLDDRKWSQAKLELLENLISTDEKIIVIITSIDPIKFFAEKAGPDNPDSYLQHRWTVALSSFSKSYHNITADKTKFKKFMSTEFPREMVYDISEQEKLKISHIRKAIFAECKHTTFLQRVGEEIVMNFNLKRDYYSKRLLIDEIYQRAEGYYQAIWSVCSMEEKITLIHLARNGLIPPKDVKIVRMLMRKGLVYKRGGFRLFNYSFKRYVRQAESSATIRRWQQSQARNWGNIKTLLVTFLIAVVLFIFVTQRDTYDSGIAWISAFAASIPALIRFLSILRPGGAKTVETSKE